MKHIYRLTLATFAALSLAPLAHAQTLTLNSGDVVAVDGTGTHGTVGGMPVSNTTTTYTTTADMQFLGAYIVAADGTSSFTLGTGGSILADSASTPYAAGLLTNDTATVLINGGNISMAGPGDFGLRSFGSSTVTIASGSIAVAQYGVGVYALSSNPVSIIGGAITTGQGGIGLEAIGGGVINLFSLGDTPFLINGVPMNNTTLPTFTSGTISGTLLDGETLDTTFDTPYNGIIHLNVGTPPVIPAPEPSQFAALSIGVLGLGSLTLRARRRFVA